MVGTLTAAGAVTPGGVFQEGGPDDPRVLPPLGSGPQPHNHAIAIAPRVASRRCPRCPPQLHA